ncbi:MAG: NADH:flavin oxidoreductase/NADH oxidase family protein [Sandaracinus sp.]|nr:NADH:flavin oxidoreductase/NADH oxidase family protein [Sandaracinus sp.]MCB9617947.1 NADH:flavin oxidoreductase/NADH oxidase family protein [Sandaracinus sp.]MCB9635442.1 NADH:flavin oxidoreductase/NADH oxidase family protein [Sandaracinus sp.]
MAPRLDDSLSLPCGLTLGNRLAKAAMTECVADPRDNQPNARHETLYRRWARGGLGLVVTGNVMVDRRYLERTTNVVIDEHTDRAALRRWAEAAQSDGVPALVQVNHAGRQCSRFVSRRPVAPSEVQVKVFGSFAKPRALEDHEVDAIATRFAEVARDVVDAGFAGVQVHAAHGYLANQFLSPRTNLRDDRWGGSLENRARFLLEAVRRTRAAIGPKAALSVKLNSADFQRGGFEEDDAVQVARWLEAEGIDLLEVSGGNYESPALMGMADERSESTKKREAYFLDFAVRLRREVRTPLMLTGGLRSADVMRSIVADGSVDVVGLARPLALEPDLPRGLLRGDVERSAMRAPRTGWKALDAMIEAGWYGLQIARMADGKEPDPNLARWRAVASYLGDESVHGLQRKVCSRV